jgi:hypothetical protein
MSPVSKAQWFWRHMEFYMATNLITRNEYKNYLGITSTTKDQEIDLLIPKVSSLVKTYCRKTFVDYYDETKIEYFDGGFPELVLKESPVVNVQQVSLSTDYGQTYTNLIKFTNWINDGDIVRCIDYPVFKPYVRGYRVAYTAGYESIPDDLKLAVLDLVEYYSKNNSAVHVNRDVTPNVTQIQYVASTNFPAHIKRVLDQYMADYV